MSTAPDTTAAGTIPAAPAASGAPKGAEALAARVQKHVDSLNAKIAKLEQENAALKAQLHAAKTSNSRIRRIPKKPVEAA